VSLFVRGERKKEEGLARRGELPSPPMGEETIVRFSPVEKEKGKKELRRGRAEVRQ